MILPSRYMQRRYNIEDPLEQSVPTLHAQTHSAIIGRMILINIKSPAAIWITAILVNVSQMIFR